MHDFIAAYPVTLKNGHNKQIAREPEFFSVAQLLSIRSFQPDVCVLETRETPEALTISARFSTLAAAFIRRWIPALTLKGKVGNPFLEMTDILLLPQNYNAPELNGDGYTRLTARPLDSFDTTARKARTIYTLTRPSEIAAQTNAALSVLTLKEPPADSFTARLQQTRTVHLPPVFSQNSQRF